jgi:dimethylhistidine N-methyltransferase
MKTDERIAVRAATIAADVRNGLTASPKTLPHYLLYDEEGSRLYEQITALPEYYLTRAEREIFEAHSSDILSRIAARDARALSVIELGAGSAAKTEVLLRALSQRQKTALYVPVDVSPSALSEAEERLRKSAPRVTVRSLQMPYDRALRPLAEVPPPRLLMFIGSSVGNLADTEASSLFDRIRDALGAGTWLLLGTDLRKAPATMLAAYDDAAGVTAAFNRNLLAHVNRELGGHFDLERFRHVARWNEVASRIEMHLESTVAQEIAVDALGLRVRFEVGETIHTESCAKYDLPRVTRLLEAGGFALETTYFDAERRFGLHLACALGG